MKKNTITALALFLLVTPVMAEKTSREKAKRLYTRLSGTQPSAAELDKLELRINNGQLVEAARDVIDETNGISNGGGFYGGTIFTWMAPKLNKQKTTLIPFNDSIATAIGLIRDEDAFNKILYDNVMYKAIGVTFKAEAWYFFHNSATPTIYPNAPALPVALSTLCGQPNNKWKVIHNNPFNPNNSNDKGCKETQYNQAQLLDAYNKTSLYLPEFDQIIETNLVKSDNRHYEHMQELGLNLGHPKLLGRTKQDVKLHAKSDAIAGILSQRGFGSAYFFAGTNRAPVAYVMEHFMCKDMEMLHDNTVPDFRNRRDVDRSPGGNSELYKNRCIGCHAGMDAQAGAFAYYDYVDGAVSYSQPSAVTKMNHNALFAEGFVTTDDSWMNLWVNGNNAGMGWGSITEGRGAKELGRMWAFTEAFHSCMALQAYEKVCLKKVTTSKDKARVAKLTSSYKGNNYNMKLLFINAAISCMED